jgi:hypothetical protein
MPLKKKQCRSVVVARSKIMVFHPGESPSSPKNNVFNTASLLAVLNLGNNVKKNWMMTHQISLDDPISDSESSALVARLWVYVVRDPTAC